MGYNYMGRNYIGHNYIRHNYTGVKEFLLVWTSIALTSGLEWSWPQVVMAFKKLWSQLARSEVIMTYQ